MARRSDHTREELRQMALDAAEKIVAEEGLRGISVRRIADAIGYTSGTLYQLFEDVGDLIEEVNGRTITGLYERCKNVPIKDNPAQSLEGLARRFRQYTRANPFLWAAIIEYQLPDGRDHSEQYTNALHGLLGLIEKAIAPYFPKGSETARLHHARLLWASCYGIYALNVSRSLAKGESVDSMTRTLIEVHLAALKSKGRQ